MKIIWQEFKYLDKSTNHSSRTEMIREIKKQGHDTKYYCTYKFAKKYYGLSKEEINYVEVPKIPKLRGLAYFLKMTFKNIIFVIRDKPDVILMDYLLLLAVLPSILLTKAFSLRTKFVLDIRTLPVELDTRKFALKMKFFNFTFKLANTFMDGLSFITPFMRKYLLQNQQIKLPVVIWTSGVNSGLFNPQLYEKNKQDGSFELFYHGGLSISRGILEIMKAICSFHSKGFAINLKLIGNMVDKNEIFDFYNREHMSNFCEILSPVPIEHIPGYIKNCDLPIIALPDFIGWRVSSPIKFFEYLAMQKPVVATKIEAYTDIIGCNDDFVYFADTYNAPDLEDAIERAYNERNSFNEKGKHARMFVLDNFTWTHQASKLIEFFKELE